MRERARRMRGFRELRRAVKRGQGAGKKCLCENHNARDYSLFGETFGDQG